MRSINILAILVALFALSLGPAALARVPNASVNACTHSVLDQNGLSEDEAKLLKPTLLLYNGRNFPVASGASIWQQCRTELESPHVAIPASSWPQPTTGLTQAKYEPSRTDVADSAIGAISDREPATTSTPSHQKGMPGVMWPLLALGVLCIFGILLLRSRRQKPAAYAASHPNPEQEALDEPRGIVHDVYADIGTPACALAAADTQVIEGSDQSERVASSEPINHGADAFRIHPVGALASIASLGTPSDFIDIPEEPRPQPLFKKGEDTVVASSGIEEAEAQPTINPNSSAGELLPSAETADAIAPGTQGETGDEVRAPSVPWKPGVLKFTLPAKDDRPEQSIKIPIKTVDRTMQNGAQGISASMPWETLVVDPLYIARSNAEGENPKFLMRKIVRELRNDEAYAWLREHDALWLAELVLDEGSNEKLQVAYGPVVPVD